MTANNFAIITDDVTITANSNGEICTELYEEVLEALFFIPRIRVVGEEVDFDGYVRSVTPSPEMGEPDVIKVDGRTITFTY